MELSDGSYYDLTSKQIVGAMFSHINEEGHLFHILSKITDHKPDAN